MRIAIDAREAVRTQKTGKGWYARALIDHMVSHARGHTFVFYTDKLESEQAREHGDGHENLPNVTKKYFPSGVIGWHLKVKNDLKKDPPDIYIAPTSYIVPALAPKGVKTIITVHDLVAWLFPTRHNVKATIIERLTLRLALKKCAHVIPVSHHTQSDLEKIFHVKKEKMTVVPCAARAAFKPISPEAKAKFRNEKSLPSTYFLSVGTLEPRKNLVTLLKSFAQIRQSPQLTSLPDEVCLVVVGGEGWSCKKIYDTVRRLNLTEQVRFVGYASEKELIGYYNTATALVFPSLYEGFGMPPLEAMQSGCPVICSNLSSLPEVVGHAAITTEPRDEQAIAEAMINISTNENLRNELREKGLRQAEKFSWARSASALLDLCEKLI